MKRLIILLMLLAGCGAFVEDGLAIKAVRDFGFSDVRIEERHIFFVEWRGCGRGDDAAFKVSGVNPKGIRVHMLVCVGWPFKGATVRMK